MSDSLMVSHFLVSKMSDSLTSLIFGERPSDSLLLLIFGQRPERLAHIVHQQRGKERESVRGGADLPLHPHALPPPNTQTSLLSCHLRSTDRHVGERGSGEYLARGPAPPPSPPHGNQLTACGARAGQSGYGVGGTTWGCVVLLPPPAHRHMAIK